MLRKTGLAGWAAAALWLPLTVASEENDNIALTVNDVIEQTASYLQRGNGLLIPH